VRLTVDIEGLKEVQQSLQGFSNRRLNAALATGLTRTAQKVAEAQRREMVDVFDRPSRYTLQGVFVRPATAQSLEAEVGIKDEFSGGNDRGQAKYLRWQIRGGQRVFTGFERALRSGGQIDGGDFAVPGRFARRTPEGNISPGQIQQILSQLRIDATRGSTRSLPTFGFDDTGKDRRRKKGVIKRAVRRAGGQFIALPKGRGKLKPGIYLVRDTGFGRTDPKPVVRFVSSASYEPERFDFFFVARLAVQRNLQAEVQRALTESVARFNLQRGAL
jgi:hypothetical protein